MPWQQKDSLALLGLAAFFVPVHIVFDVLRYGPVWCTFVVTTFNYASVHPAVSTLVEGFFSLNKWAQTFIILFLFRYTRLVVNTLSFLTYKPTPIPIFPRISMQLPENVTVIIPTVEPSGIDFENCIYSIMKNNPAEIIIVTAGTGTETEARKACNSYYNASVFRFFHCKIPNKRTQVCEALPKVGPFKTSHTQTMDLLSLKTVQWPQGYKELARIYPK